MVTPPKERSWCINGRRRSRRPGRSVRSGHQQAEEQETPPRSLGLRLLSAECRRQPSAPVQPPGAQVRSRQPWSYREPPHRRCARVAGVWCVWSSDVHTHMRWAAAWLRLCLCVMNECFHGHSEPEWSGNDRNSSAQSWSGSRRGGPHDRCCVTFQLEAPTFGVSEGRASGCQR